MTDCTRNNVVVTVTMTRLSLCAAVVVVQFGQTSYNVAEEEGFLLVEILTSGPAHTTMMVDIAITSQSGTAEGTVTGTLSCEMFHLF